MTKLSEFSHIFNKISDGEIFRRVTISYLEVSQPSKLREEAFNKSTREIMHAEIQCKSEGQRLDI